MISVTKISMRSVCIVRLTNNYLKMRGELIFVDYQFEE